MGAKATTRSRFGACALTAALAVPLMLVVAIVDFAGGQGDTSMPSTYLEVALSDDQVVDGTSGAVGGRGFASMEVDVGRSRVCYLVAVLGVDRPTAFQIRLGGRTATGRHLVHVDEPVDESDYLAGAAEWRGCQSVDPETARALTTVTAAYVQVYSETHPWGAVRGQFGSAEPLFLEAGMVGGELRPGPGDQPTTGLIDVTRYGTILCYDLAVTPGVTAAAASLRSVAGGTVLDLELDQALRRTGSSRGSIEATRCLDVGQDLVDDLAANPNGFEVGLDADEPTLGIASGPASVASAEPAVRGRTDRLPPFTVAELTGGGVIGVDGDPDGSALVGITLYPGVLCQQVRTESSDRPTGLRIRSGADGTVGPAVYDAWVWLDPFTRIDENSFGYAACRRVPDLLIELLLERPQDFYVEMTTTGHPLGALRSQLAG